MAPKSKEKVEPKYITSEELSSTLDKFGDKVVALIDNLEKKIESTAVIKPEVTENEAAVAKAGPNKFTTNDEWDEEARKIIGEAVDHTEVVHERNGGVKFTVVIKNEHSNAGEMYLDLVKTDRRTKEVGSEGIAGVINWCQLIKQNLARPSAAKQRNI